jgi:phosphoribosylformylglycinamidine (FGAM) synthase-like enzyme
MMLKSGDVLLRIGAPPTTLEGSFAAWQAAPGLGSVKPLALEAVAALCTLVRELRVGGHVLDAWPVLAGGLAQTLFSIGLANEMPVRSTLPDGEDFLVSYLGEDRLCMVVAVDNQGVAAVQARCAAAGIEACVLGAVGVTPDFSLQDHQGDRRFAMPFGSLVEAAEGVVGRIVAGTFQTGSGA